ncbi:MAG TPA: glycosyltransferase family 2 protein [Candidatus Saccharimonadales bacterium]|nr:glycosyltransferase family 2 protein [Candidatus Saccharimonadales bacterium]
MTDIEIPFEKNRRGHYRFFEILPGALSWTLLFMPLILSYVNITLQDTKINLAVVFVLAYLLIYFVRSVGYTLRALGGYRVMKQCLKLDWNGLCADVEAGAPTDHDLGRPSWHFANLARLERREHRFKPSQLTHAVIIATVNESREVLEPTIQAVLEADYDPKKMILVIAYEGRAGEPAEQRVKDLIKDYGRNFKHAMAVQHPSNIPGEIIGKGGNVTHAGRALQKYLEAEKIDPATVIVTTLDADNRPDRRYFASLSYLYCVVPDPLKASYQPLPMFTNNIWDAPTLMRVIATGNNLFYIVGTQRPHRSRNFSAHAQPMKSLIDMDFWSVRTIVEDGHHFWRSYFHFDGDYRVYPLSIPIYQDAVLADGYWRTMKAQFVQLRRWTYGASDVAYIADKAFWHKNKVPKVDALAKLLTTLEGHVTWATGTLLVFGAAFIPPLLHPQLLAANILPLTVSRIQRIGIIGLLASVYVCLLTLPPRPARYKRHRSVMMVLQWALTPVTAIGYSSLAAFNSQTRLMFGWYLSKFDVTEKAVVNAAGETHSSDADPTAAKKRRWPRKKKR